MPKIFTTLDKIRPAYDITYKIVMLLCKILLVADILIASYAVLGSMNSSASWLSSKIRPGPSRWC